MKRQYFLRGRLIEVDQIDNVVAVQSAPSDRSSARSFGLAADSEIRGVAPAVQDDALAAFSAAGWQLVVPSASTREALAGGGRADEIQGVGTVVVDTHGRVGIASSLLNVQVKAELSEAEAEQVVADAGLRIVNKLNFAPNLYEVRAERGDAMDASLALNDNPDFVFAEPSLIEHIPQRFTPSDPRYIEQWQWKNTGAAGGTVGADVNVEPAWDHTFGAGIQVAVLDNGFDAGHEDLAAGIAAGAGFYTDGTGGGAATFTAGTAGMPDSNHGTFCAGMVGARRGNGNGGVGAAPDCDLMLVACLGDQVGTQTTLARAVAYAANPATEPDAPATPGADIIVSSLGPNGADWALTSTLDLALQGAAVNGRGGRGCAIFWAASNGRNVDVMADEVVSHPDVIAVVRSNRNDREDNAARGPEVELIAPGVSVVSTESGDSYGDSTGTSFAAPCAAGCAALALSVNPALTRDQLREIMHNTADKIGGVVYDAAGHNDDYGFGRVNAFNAVKAAARRIALVTSEVVFDDVPEAETASRSITWEVSGLNSFTFEVITGPTTSSGPADSFQLLQGDSVTTPAPGIGVTNQVQLWLTYTGTAAGDTATGNIVVRGTVTNESWTIPLSANTIDPSPAVAGGVRKPLAEGARHES